MYTESDDKGESEVVIVVIGHTCNMLCLKLDATKMAIDFYGKKKSNCFAVFTAKFISFVATIKKKEMWGRSKTISFICQPILATF